jgi:hypothetical protein
MTMPRSFTSGYKPRIFQSHVGFILGIDSCYATLVTNTYAPMCIFVGKCPTIGGFYLPTILLGWQQIKAWIIELMQVDVISFGSQAYRF